MSRHRTMFSVGPEAIGLDELVHAEMDMGRRVGLRPSTAVAPERGTTAFEVTVGERPVARLEHSRMVILDHDLDPRRCVRALKRLQLSYYGLPLTFHYRPSRGYVYVCQGEERLIGNSDPFRME